MPQEPSTNDDSPRGTTAEGPDPLLAVEDLRTHVRTDRGTVHAVDGVSFAVDRGETVCVVGESGSGKSVTCRSLTGLVDDPVEVVGGSVSFDGTDLVATEERRLRQVRGDHIAHVFQNSQGALDPVYTVGDQVAEALAIHRDVSKAAARDRAVELLRAVGIPRADDRADDYPHEFSGGMAQRAAIAVALAADPDLVVADEPTTAVDVTVQARLLDLFRDLVGDGTGLLLVTHDLRVVAALADRVLVMFGGTVVERGPVEAVFERPAHPYTQALFESYRGHAPDGDRSARRDVPTDGCRFREECDHAVEACAGGDQPPFHPAGDGDDHRASCVHFAPERDPGTVLDAGTEASPSERGAGTEPERSGGIDD